jgi:putative membrane protein
MWKLIPHEIVWLLAFAAMAIYALGARRGVSSRRHGAFAAGLASTLLVTASPLSEASEALFSLHMIQHLALILICAPLFAAAQLSIPISRAAARLSKWAGLPPPRALLQLGRALAKPLPVWLAFCGLFVFWHLPRPYAWALQNESGHVLEHGCFFLSALAFWSVVLARGSHAPGTGARLVFVGTAALLSGLPGALITLSTRPLYPIHADAAVRFGLTALEDQQLAVFIMWAPMGLAYLLAMLVLLTRWLAEGEVRARRGSAWTVVLLGCLLTALAGCDEGPGAAAPNGGDPREGAKLISAIGCGACHTIPGVNGANGLVGPSLDQIGRRTYIAGVLRNTPENLQEWLQNPQKFVPGVVMPNLGLSDDQSRNIAAYLSTLR